MLFLFVFNDDFLGDSLVSLLGLEDIDSGSQVIGRDFLSSDTIDGAFVEIEVLKVDRGVVYLVITYEGYEGDESIAGVVKLVDDMVFHLLFVGSAPIIAHCHDVAGGVVVQVVGDATVAVVHDVVASPFFFSAEVNIVEVDGSDAPEVAGDGVVAQDGFAVGGGAIDGDAAASVHRVGLVVIVEELVLNED